VLLLYISLEFGFAEEVLERSVFKWVLTFRIFQKYPVVLPLISLRLPVVPWCCKWPTFFNWCFLSLESNYFQLKEWIWTIFRKFGVGLCTFRIFQKYPVFPPLSISKYSNSCFYHLKVIVLIKVIPQFCIAHFYCAHLITYNFIHYTYRFKKKSFYDNFMLLQNIFGYIRAKNYFKINVFKKGIQKCS
jgi:hypothetical protein